MGAQPSGDSLSQTRPAGWLPCTPDSPRCEFWTWSLDYLRPACCTRHLQEVLGFTEDLLRRHGIFHFLDYGSLLGAVRSQTLIDWDEDADFSCLSSDAAKVKRLEAEVASAGFWMDTREFPHVLRICRSRANLAHADLWFQRLEKGFAYSWSLLHEERFRFPVRYLERLGTVTLEGRSHPAPEPVHRFLADHRYGADFMTPRRVSADFGWISGSTLSPQVSEALEELREIEHRIWRLEARRTNVELAPPRHWLNRTFSAVPRPLLRVHRQLWKAWQQGIGKQAGTKDRALLEVRYELYRREAALRRLES